MHKYTGSQCDFRHEKSVMGIWFSNLVELIKIKVAVSCVNWELQVNLVVGLGKRGFILCWWVAPSRGKPACRSRPARRKALLLLGWLCLRHSVKPRDMHTHTHKPDPASMENIPALWVLRQETWLAEKKSLGARRVCPPRASSLLPYVASLVWLFRNPCTALIWGSWKSRDVWS